MVEMRSMYTENYPDIISLKQEIAQLEKEVAQASNSKEPPSVSIGSAKSCPYVDMRTRLSNAEVQLAILQHRVSVATDKLANSKKNMVQILAINNKYADLDRDYSVIESNYNALVKSREAARMSQAMSDQQESISYRVIEPPKRTEFPISPPRTFFNALVLLLGLAAGVGLAILLERLQRSLLDQRGVGRIFLLTAYWRDFRGDKSSSGQAGAAVHNLAYCWRPVINRRLWRGYLAPHHLHL